MALLKGGTRATQKLRQACMAAITERYGAERELHMERRDGDAYVALFCGAEDMIRACVPNRRADPIEIYLDRGILAD